MEEELILEALAALAGCVCEEVSANGDLCFCGITLGDQYISMAGIGDCEDACGEAWVRVTNVFTGDVLGQPQQFPISCDTGISLSIEIGTLRCMDIAEDGEAPTPEELLAATTLQMKDMFALKRAMLCCTHFSDVLPGTWSPRGPEGGLVGGTWTLTVGI